MGTDAMAVFTRRYQRMVVCYRNHPLLRQPLSAEPERGALGGRDYTAGWISFSGGLGLPGMGSLENMSESTTFVFPSAPVMRRMDYGDGFMPNPPMLFPMNGGFAFA